MRSGRPSKRVIVVGFRTATVQVNWMRAHIPHDSEMRVPRPSRL